MRELENCSEEKLNKMKLVLDGNAEAVAPEPAASKQTCCSRTSITRANTEETLKGEVINLESEPEHFESISLDLNSETRSTSAGNPRTSAGSPRTSAIVAPEPARLPLNQRQAPEPYSSPRTN